MYKDFFFFFKDINGNYIDSSQRLIAAESLTIWPFLSCEQWWLCTFAQTKYKESKGSQLPTGTTWLRWPMGWILPAVPPLFAEQMDKWLIKQPSHFRVCLHFKHSRWTIPVSVRLQCYFLNHEGSGKQWEALLPTTIPAEGTARPKFVPRSLKHWF